MMNVPVTKLALMDGAKIPARLMTFALPHLNVEYMTITSTAHVLLDLKAVEAQIVERVLYIKKII